MSRLLIVSDLHPEKGKNKNFYDYLKVASHIYHIFFNGDCRQYPNSYTGVPHINIIGNRDSNKGGNEGSNINDIYIVHSHQWDPNAETGGLVQDSIWSFFKSLFNSKKISFGTTHVITELDVMLKRGCAPEEADRLTNKVVPATKLKFPLVNSIIMGHKHIRYAIVIDGVLCINTGAGWKGEHVTIENDNSVLFHSFR